MPIRPRYADLFAALLDPDPSRADAAFDAILFDRALALDDLAELYRTSPREPVLRFYAVQLLGFTGSAQAIPAVLEALDDADPRVRAEACRALEDLRAKDAAAVRALYARTEDMDPDVRGAARDALQALGRDPFAAPPA